MSTVTVVGGTGFAGRHLAREAAARGHRVTVVSRSASAATSPEGDVAHAAVDVREPGALDPHVGEADVVVLALSPRGPLAGHLAGVYRDVADRVAASGGRLYVVGGFSSLRGAPDGPRLVETGMPETDLIPREQLEAMMAEAREMNSVLEDLEARDDDLRWTFVSPGMDFGAHVPGEPTGAYRVSQDGLVLADAEGRSALGGADLAVAVLDEVESDSPRRGHLAIAY